MRSRQMHAASARSVHLQWRYPKVRRTARIARRPQFARAFFFPCRDASTTELGQINFELGPRRKHRLPKGRIANSAIRRGAAPAGSPSTRESTDSPRVLPPLHTAEQERLDWLLHIEIARKNSRALVPGELRSARVCGARRGRPKERRTDGRQCTRRISRRRNQLPATDVRTCTRHG
jgi:hypothetical protein